MSLFDPRSLTNPYKDAFTIGALPPTEKLETGPTPGYELEQKGIRSETSQTIIINRGEIETAAPDGGYIQYQVAVVNENESYIKPITFVDVGAGETGLIPVLDQPANEEGVTTEQQQTYEAAEYYEQTYSEPVETAPDYNVYEERSSFYTNETGEHFIPHEVIFYPVDPNVYDFGNNFETY